MQIVITIALLIFVLSVLVFIHEAGHYLSARAFGVRVTEFMLGLPGPRIGFTWRGTRFGVTAVPLGGYARVCGMEVGEISQYAKPVLALSYERGSISLEECALALGISEKDALDTLDELVAWGSLVEPYKTDDEPIYRTPASVAGDRAQVKFFGKAHYSEGQPRPIHDLDGFYASELSCQFRSQSFIKRAIILLAGPGINLLFAMLVFVLVYSVLGIDVIKPGTQEVVHVVLDPLRALGVGFGYIGAVITAVAGLFNPVTAAETVSQSSSLIGIAALSKQAFDAGLINFMLFMAMISVSLGIMNLIPIPPLDGGRFVVECYQSLFKRTMTPKNLARFSAVGIALMVLLFVIMMNQDIQRFILGNWS